MMNVWLDNYDAGTYNLGQGRCELSAVMMVHGTNEINLVLQELP